MFYLGSTNDGTDGLAIVTNMNGRHVSCEFPFLYNKEQYNYCITKGSTSHAPWCGTTKTYDHYGLWDYCPAAGKLPWLLCRYCKFKLPPNDNNRYYVLRLQSKTAWT